MSLVALQLSVSVKPLSALRSYYLMLDVAEPLPALPQRQGVSKPSDPAIDDDSGIPKPSAFLLSADPAKTCLRPFIYAMYIVEGRARFRPFNFLNCEIVPVVCSRTCKNRPTWESPTVMIDPLSSRSGPRDVCQVPPQRRTK